VLYIFIQPGFGLTLSCFFEICVIFRITCTMSGILTMTNDMQTGDKHVW